MLDRELRPIWDGSVLFVVAPKFVHLLLSASQKMSKKKCKIDAAFVGRRAMLDPQKNAAHGDVLHCFGIHKS
jgi:hypothetical protein